MNPTIFLDRDGTLIKEVGYLKNPEQVELLPGVVEGLRLLNTYKLHSVVVTNQSGIGRGLMTIHDVEAVNKRFLTLLNQQSIQLSGLYYCPHSPELNCFCRKPRPGLLQQASSDLGIPWQGGISIGDRFRDVELCQNNGGKGILVLTGYGQASLVEHQGIPADFVAPNFQTAVEWILKTMQERISI